MTDDYALGIDVSQLATVVVSPSAEVKFVFQTTQDGSLDHVFQVNVALIDQYGNDVPDNTIMVTVVAQVGTSTQTVAVGLASGIGTANFSFTQAGPVSLSLMDTFATGLDVTATSSFVVNAGLIYIAPLPISSHSNLFRLNCKVHYSCANKRHACQPQPAWLGRQLRQRDH